MQTVEEEGSNGTHDEAVEHRLISRIGEQSLGSYESELDTARRGKGSEGARSTSSISS